MDPNFSQPFISANDKLACCLFFLIYPTTLWRTFQVWIIHSLPLANAARVFSVMFTSSIFSKLQIDFCFFQLILLSFQWNEFGNKLVVYLRILNMLLECIFSISKRSLNFIKAEVPSITYHHHLALYHRDYVNQINSSNFLMKLSKL